MSLLAIELICPDCSTSIRDMSVVSYDNEPSKADLDKHKKFPWDQISFKFGEAHWKIKCDCGRQGTVYDLTARVFKGTKEEYERKYGL